MKTSLFATIRWLFLLLFCSFPCYALTLRDLCTNFLPGDALAYRSGKQVIILKFESIHPLMISHQQLDALTFFSLKPWTHWLERLSFTPNDEDQSSVSLIHQLLDLPLETETRAKTFKPKLDILHSVAAVEWDIKCVSLGSSFQEPFNGKQLVLYLPKNSNLSQQDLPTEWPYWIETQHQARKWVMYLINVHLNR